MTGRLAGGRAQAPPCSTACGSRAGGPWGHRGPGEKLPRSASLPSLSGTSWSPPCLPALLSFLLLQTSTSPSIYFYFGAAQCDTILYQRRRTARWSDNPVLGRLVPLRPPVRHGVPCRSATSLQCTAFELPSSWGGGRQRQSPFPKPLSKSRDQGSRDGEQLFSPVTYFTGD